MGEDILSSAFRASPSNAEIRVPTTDKGECRDEGDGREGRKGGRGYQQ